MPDPGKLLQHKHSLAKYWYIGPVPQTNVHSIVSQETRQAYTVGTRELELYYTEAPNPRDLRVGGTYKSTSTGSYFQVESIYVNPGSGDKVAFGWYSFDGNLAGDKVYPHVALQEHWNKWKPV